MFVSIKKNWYIYTTEYYSAIKKNEIRTFSNTIHKNKLKID